MLSTHLRVLGVAFVSAFALIGCGSGDTTEGAGTTGGTTSSNPDDNKAPDFTGAGQEETPQAAYPAGPFGIKKGSIIENFKFVGFANSATTIKSLQEISLADFYNPTGKDTYPADSQYHPGEAKPVALIIDIASVWCGPCNEEAGSVLPGQATKYQPMGGEFLGQLADGPMGGISATGTDLTNWVKKYQVSKKVAYPMVYDPEYKLGALFAEDAFPNNMIIDLRTMKICQVIAGAPSPNDSSDPQGKAFWTLYENVINDPTACK